MLVVPVTRSKSSVSREIALMGVLSLSLLFCLFLWLSVCQIIHLFPLFDAVTTYECEKVTQKYIKMLQKLSVPLSSLATESQLCCLLLRSKSAEGETGLEVGI